MSNLRRALQLRALLTETLPYEVPVIFSNDRFHASLAAPAGGRLGELVRTVHDVDTNWTVPYSYEIAKDATRRTTLGIIHPSTQRRITEFYELHYGSLLGYCANDRFSLRRPIALASTHAKGPIIADDDAHERTGVAQLLADAGEPDVSHLASYFAYGKYTLLGKFVASREFIRLETKFTQQRRLDIQKCFYNIYTHSITWAVKSKPFAKDNVNAYSFEAKFDKLMQQSNYNETNGIIVGPEVSRIFAEIILQNIDQCVQRELDAQGYTAGRHYDIRRYVDDYFIFSNEEIVLDQCQDAVVKHLERYKLFLNQAKTETVSRPFVSNLTLARAEVAATLKDIGRTLAQIRASADNSLLQREYGQLRRQLGEVRLVVAKYKIDFANLSAWLLSRVKRIIRACIKDMGETPDAERRTLLGDVAVGALESAFYICALDLRVRTTYSICQLVLQFDRSKSHFTAEQNDLVHHIISDEVTGLVKASRVRGGSSFGSSDSVEIYNLLICGSEFIGQDFATSPIVHETAQAFVDGRMTYFAFVSLKFCLLKDRLRNAAFLAAVNAKARERLMATGVDIKRDCELYLLAVDYLASPDIPPAEKQSVCTQLFGATASHQTLNQVGNHIGFADWDGLTVEHLLARKELRPVYSWG